MFYYSGKNLTPLIVSLTFCGIIVLCLNLPCKNNVLVERIIGYSIDEMIRASDSSIYYDTTAIIYKKGDSLFIRGTGSYTFKRKDSLECPKKKPTSQK